MTFQHVPVLLQETLSGLNIQPEGIYVDGTVGGAGHACEIAKQLHGAGRLIGLDRDPDAVAVATQRLAPYPATVIHANYDEMAQVLQRLEIPAVDGILLDLGVSSHQLDTEERGFSYHTDAPLDMRMSQSGMSAADVVNTWSQEELTRILFAYGEESFARAIARNICQARQEQPITTTLQLAEIVKSSVPQRVRRAKNPCKQTFQAIRIAVNDEFGHLERALTAAFSCLKPRRKIGDYYVSFFGRPHGETAVCKMVSRLYLSTGFSKMCLWQSPAGKIGESKANCCRCGGTGRKPEKPKCKTACHRKECGD